MKGVKNNGIYKMLLFLILFFVLEATAFAQGYNHTWLLGYLNNTSNDKGRLNFTDTSVTYITEIRKIPFGGTQANISDENGNLLMSSNGIFIANATGDTMQDGGGLNPNLYTDGWKLYGLPFSYANIIIPMPDDTNKYILFHQTGSDVVLASTEIYYSIADMSYNGGLGKVISKNNIIKTGTFGYGLSACKHGNGRDWWIFSISINADSVYKYLLTHDSIYYMGNQYLNLTVSQGWAGQPTFSSDGNKFSFATGYGNSSSGIWYHDVRIFDFDRCSGIFSNETLVPLTADSIAGFGIAFSPDSKYLYVSSWQTIYQLNVDTINVPASLKVVAVNDTFLSPSFPFYTDFWTMYLAANGKIYITSGSSVVDLHYINYPDSADTACDVHLHDFHLLGFHFRSVPNHPNYYLGRLVGSVCDTLTSINDLTEHNFKFSISPNPNNGNFKIMYLLPQNKAGKLEIFDINGRAVYSQNLPQWSTLQFISLPKIANGIYAIKINSDNFSVTKKLIIHHE
ncbi:MAG: T9SS type A sorting domain-containing protein [Bacteroidetes bacterium]|nr:T9SS type A sorting domain-containing protein [Bacteroidota bacterium]MCW5931880.1 T9SS type A sorting domain-containing protein [Bacteroidota bacterium]